MSAAGYDSPQFAEFYDQLPLYANRQDVEFFVAEAVASGGPVLELGCGTGRVLLPTARAGVEICGLDGSPAMLERCCSKLSVESAEVQSRVLLQQGDMRDFRFDRKFRLVTLPFRPFQHLIEVEDQLRCLACIRQALADDGRLIVDVFNPSLPGLVDESRLTEQPSGDGFRLADGRHVARTERIAARDLFRQVLQVELIYYVTAADQTQERLVHSFPMRYFFRFELEHLLARSGFQIEQAYCDYDRAPLGAKEPGELIYVARKAR
jgi:SAM-dependent methyltransferase